MFSGKLTKLELRARWSAGDSARVEEKASTPPRASRHEVRTSLVRPMLPAAALILKMIQSPMARRLQRFSRPTPRLLLESRSSANDAGISAHLHQQRVCRRSVAAGVPPVIRRSSPRRAGRDGLGRRRETTVQSYDRVGQGKNHADTRGNERSRRRAVRRGTGARRQLRSRRGLGWDVLRALAE